MSGHIYNMDLNTEYFTSPIGVIRIEAVASGITTVVFCDEDEERIPDERPSEYTRQCVQQLQQYFAGERKTFTCRLCPSGTAFQKQVWQLLQYIPYGITTTYKAQALQLGDVKSIRAVASANGKNPIAVLIPCHRVVGSSGKLTGYAGGLWRKAWLLEHEAYQTTGFKKLI